MLLKRGGGGGCRPFTVSGFRGFHKPDRLNPESPKPQTLNPNSRETLNPKIQKPKHLGVTSWRSNFSSGKRVGLTRIVFGGPGNSKTAYCRGLDNFSRVLGSQKLENSTGSSLGPCIRAEGFVGPLLVLPCSSLLHCTHVALV